MEKKGWWRAVNKKNKDQLPKPDLGQGRKFVRPLAALYRQAMAEEDKERNKDNPQSDPVAEGIREATADIFDGLIKEGFLAGVKPIDGDDPEKPWNVSESWRQRVEEAEEAFRQSGLDYRDQKSLGNILFPYWNEFVVHLAGGKVADEWDKLKPDEKIVRANSLAPDWNFQQFGLAVLAGYLRKKIVKEERSL